MQSTNGLTMGKKIVIVSMLCVVILLLSVAAFLLPTSGGIKGDNTRTIMIYMAGNNLETNNAIATSDLNKIVPSEVDLEHNKVLLYTGGTKMWHNYISANEEAIYELTPEGFKKVQIYVKNNMGNDNALSSFLKYSYDYSKTDNYDLIYWGHGLGALGTVMDENTNDWIDLSEMETAFEKSPFNQNNKLESVIFRTCLNSTLEVAGTLYPYAKYMIASEEVTYGANGFGVLGFLNDINNSYTSIDYGKAYINSYKSQMEGMDVYGTVGSTYAIIDLSKIPELITMMDNFFAKVDVGENYRDISRIRANMSQYGGDYKDYDTVDLYETIDNLKEYNKSDANKILKYIKNDVVVYSWITREHSNGLSVYFPFNGSVSSKAMHLSLYNRINVSSNYRTFINKFNDGMTSPSYSFAYDLTDNEIKQDGKEFKLKLSEDQQNNFAKASYIIFRKEDDGFYMPVYGGRGAKLDKNGYLTTNITNKIIQVVDDTGDKAFFTVYQTDSKNDDYTEYTTNIILHRPIEEGELKGLPILENASIHLKVDKKNKVHVGEVVIDYDNGFDLKNPTGTVVNLKDYNVVDFPTFRYGIVDENGNYKKPEEWTKNNIKYMWEVKGDFHFETTSLDNSGDYYCVFVITDIQNNTYYSNLISID